MGIRIKGKPLYSLHYTDDQVNRGKGSDDLEFIHKILNSAS